MGSHRKKVAVDVPLASWRMPLVLLLTSVVVGDNRNEQSPAGADENVGRESSLTETSLLFESTRPKIDPKGGIITQAVELPATKEGNLGGRRIIAFDFEPIMPPYDSLTDGMLLLNAKKREESSSREQYGEILLDDGDMKSGGGQGDNFDVAIGENAGARRHSDAETEDTSDYDVPQDDVSSTVAGGLTHSADIGANVIAHSEVEEEADPERTSTVNFEQSTISAKVGPIETIHLQEEDKEEAKSDSSPDKANSAVHRARSIAPGTNEMTPPAEDEKHEAESTPDGAGTEAKEESSTEVNSNETKSTGEKEKADLKGPSDKADSVVEASDAVEFNAEEMMPPIDNEEADSKSSADDDDIAAKEAKIEEGNGVRNEDSSRDINVEASLDDNENNNVGNLQRMGKSADTLPSDAYAAHGYTAPDVSSEGGNVTDDNNLDEADDPKKAELTSDTGVATELDASCIADTTTPMASVAEDDNKSRGNTRESGIADSRLMQELIDHETEATQTVVENADSDTYRGGKGRENDGAGFFQRNSASGAQSPGSAVSNEIEEKQALAWKEEKRFDSDSELKEFASAPTVETKTSDSLGAGEDNSSPPTSSSFSSTTKNKKASVNYEFVHGLDDLHKFVEEVDPPDELDVGAAGSSMQEVLMGQGVQILKKRLSMGVHHVQRTVAHLRRRARNRRDKTPPRKKDAEVASATGHKGDNVADSLKGPFSFAVVSVEKNKERLMKATRAIRKICMRFVEQCRSIIEEWFGGEEEDDEGDEVSDIISKLDVMKSRAEQRRHGDSVPVGGGSSASQEATGSQPPDSNTKTSPIPEGRLTSEELQKLIERSRHRAKWNSGE